MPSLFLLPYVPKKRLKRERSPFVSTHNYLHRIAYTETVRGLRDDIPTLLFHAPFALLKETCQHLYKLMDGKVKNLRICNEHSCRVRNGKSYWMVAVQIIGLDEHFISLQEFTLMLVNHIQRVCNCTVRHYRLETFLNL